MKTYVCQECNNEYVRREQGKFCSRKCLGKSNGRRVTNSKKTYTEEEKMEILKRSFFKKAVIKNGCWDWKGYVARTGYVLIRFLEKKISGHRASWMIHNGEIPEGLCVLHTCDNRVCTNPAHLWLGTTKENAVDRQNKNRGQKGEKHNKAKLNENSVREIRKMIEDDFSLSEIAKLFGVCDGTIWFIKHNVTWSHVQ